ncbi:MAG: hypothetical protein MZV70_22470 [Desulfobacterales bacterium]|nr:hypothetical protein [Desulfobacterales bacterium]
MEPLRDLTWMKYLLTGPPPNGRSGRGSPRLSPGAPGPRSGTWRRYRFRAFVLEPSARSPVLAVNLESDILGEYLLTLEDARGRSVLDRYDREPAYEEYRIRALEEAGAEDASRGPGRTAPAAGAGTRRTPGRAPGTSRPSPRGSPMRQLTAHPARRLPSRRFLVLALRRVSSSRPPAGARPGGGALLRLRLLPRAPEGFIPERRGRGLPVLLHGSRRESSCSRSSCTNPPGTAGARAMLADIGQKLAARADSEAFTYQRRGRRPGGPELSRCPASAAPGLGALRRRGPAERRGQAREGHRPPWPTCPRSGTRRTCPSSSPAWTDSPRTRKPGSYPRSGQPVQPPLGPGRAEARGPALREQDSPDLPTTRGKARRPRTRWNGEFQVFSALWPGPPRTLAPDRLGAVLPDGLPGDLPPPGLPGPGPPAGAVRGARRTGPDGPSARLDPGIPVRAGTAREATS